MNNHAHNPIPFSFVFDFGGVLVDWNPRYLYCKLLDGDTKAVETFLAEVHFAEWNLEQDRGRSWSQAVAELSAEFPHYRPLIQAYYIRWEESISGAIQPTVEILAGLKRAGYPLFGLSNWSMEMFKRVQPRCPFFAWFQDILISSEVELIKPDPRIFTLLLERNGLKAQQCVLIDDSRTNVDVARELGFMGIHFQSPEGLRETLLQMEIRL